MAGHSFSPTLLRPLFVQSEFILGFSGKVTGCFGTHVHVFTSVHTLIVASGDVKPPMLTGTIVGIYFVHIPMVQLLYKRKF